MENIIEVNKRLLILKSDLKLTEKIFAMHSKNKITNNEFKEKIKKLKEKLLNSFKEVNDLTETIEKNKKNCEDVKFYIAEHLLHNNYIDIAKGYAQKHHIDINFNFYITLFNIIEEIKNYNFEKALFFCKENKIHLKSINVPYKNQIINGSELENQLKIYTFQDMCKKCTKKEAVKYSQQHFYTNKEVIKPYLVLLVCKDYNVINKYKIENTEDLSEFFKIVYLALHSLTPKSRLSKRIEYGLVAFKTKMCSIKFNSECPSCLKIVQNLSKVLPYCKKDNSVILCRGSGLEMNESNQPFCFESGYVYCEDYISKLNYNYACKVTGITCKKNPKICYFV